MFFEERPCPCPGDTNLIWVFLGSEAFARKPRALEMVWLVAWVCTDPGNLIWNDTPDFNPQFLVGRHTEKFPGCAARR